MLQLLRVIEILMGFALIGMSGAVFFVYLKKIRRNRRPILPRHVALISLSYCGLVAIIVIDQATRVVNDSPTFWRLTAAFPFFLMGLIALRLVLDSLRPSPWPGPERRAVPDRRR